MIKTLTKIKQRNRSLCKKRRFAPPMPKRAVRNTPPRAIRCRRTRRKADGLDFNVQTACFVKRPSENEKRKEKQGAENGSPPHRKIPVRTAEHRRRAGIRRSGRREKSRPRRPDADCAEQSEYRRCRIHAKPLLCRAGLYRQIAPVRRRRRARVGHQYRQRQCGYGRPRARRRGGSLRGRRAAGGLQTFADITVFYRRDTGAAARSENHRCAAQCQTRTLERRRPRDYDHRHRVQGRQPRGESR